MRSILLSLLLLGLAGCSVVYKLPTRQGNVIDQQQFDRLKVGQTREQVKFLLGTPIATSPFRNDRWDYYGYYKDPRGKVSARTVTVFFEGDTLNRVEGVELAKNSSTTPAATAPDAAKTEPSQDDKADPLSKGTQSDVN